MSTPEPKKKEIKDAEAQEMACTVIQHHFGKKPRKITAMSGGLTNFVFEAATPDGDVIIRMCPDTSKIKDYLKEQWAITKAGEAGVPVPEVLEVGADLIPMPYMIARKVEGRDGTQHADPLALLKEMGRLTALIHTIPTSGFGHIFDWSGNQLSRKETWADYLKRELHLEERLHVLEKNRMLSPKQARGLRSALKRIESWKASPVLNHGDMRLKNVIVEEGKPKVRAVLDWEFCSSNIASYWDLSLALHDLSIDQKQAFISGYGLGEKQILAHAQVLKALNVINYAPYVEAAARENDKVRLEQYRIRFSGALDLYSL